MFPQWLKGWVKCHTVDTEQIHRCDFSLFFLIFLQLRCKKDKKKLFEVSRPIPLFPFCYIVCAALILLQTVSSPCLSLSLSLMSHFAPSFPHTPTPPFILLLSFSHVLQHPRLPATWLCGESDRGSLKQRGALGLRQRLQADWKRLSGVQEDHPQLLHLGRPGARLPRWGSLPTPPKF